MDLRATSRDEHVVKDGRVRCVMLRRDVAVQRCWMCDRLIGFDVDAGRENVLCACGSAAMS